MWDLPDNEKLAEIAANIYENGGVVAAVCHGPAGLVNIKLSDGKYLVDRKVVCSFTNEEEEEAGLTNVVPFLLMDKLMERGARHSHVDKWEPHAETDDRLVTGQNPASTADVGRGILRVLKRNNL